MFANVICPCCQPLLAQSGISESNVQRNEAELEFFLLLYSGLHPFAFLQKKIRKFFLPEVRSRVESVQFLLDHKVAEEGQEQSCLAVCTQLHAIAPARTHTKSDNKRFLIKYF